VDSLRLGSVIRALRLRHGWRQTDVARRAGVSTSTVSRAERGRFDELTVASVPAVARALDVRVEWNAWWRGGELTRMLNAGHAAMHELVVRDLTVLGWMIAPEVSFSVYGERGIVDILAYHPGQRALLVVELKTQLVDVGQLIGAVDRYRRLAPQLAGERRWQVGQVSAWVPLLRTATNRRRVAAHASVLRAAFPDDGRRVGPWLRQPAGTIAALSFVSIGRHTTAIAASSGVQRVRGRCASVPRRPDRR
jgi:transcriptional regulator with XRE-family HTH domain